ncbi:MAG: response regulator [Phycisphaerae bacterium]|nr:response regulator [Phycisphaerae bacterium]
MPELKTQGLELKPILLIEDDSIDAMTVKRAVNELKVKNKLTHFTNCEDALEYLQSGADRGACVILLDLNLPGMNGVEFLKIVKADGVLRNIPVVMLAASQQEEDIVETFNLGVAGYIFKPANTKKFEEFEPIKRYWTVNKG